LGGGGRGGLMERVSKATVCKGFLKLLLLLLRLLLPLLFIPVGGWAVVRLLLSLLAALETGLLLLVNALLTSSLNAF